MALLSETKKFIFLEEGDVAEIKLDKITIFDLDGNLVDRPVINSKIKLQVKLIRVIMIISCKKKSLNNPKQ